MLAYIKGKIDSKTNNYIVIDVGGLGYKVNMSETAIEQVGKEGEEVKVHTYYRVREDDISIFGFITKEELRTFELLLTVSGVGAKVALAILANISVAEFAMAILQNDVSKIVKVPGIGKKSAERIILELKDKINKLQTEVEIKEINKQIEKQKDIEENVEEAISALQVLGYNKKAIENVFEKIENTGLSTEELIRKGLALL